MRQCIERSFGIMVTRWGILWRTLRVDFCMIPVLLTALAKLHNFCIDEKDGDPYRKRYHKDIRAGDSLNVHMNDNHIDPSNGWRRRNHRVIDEDEKNFLSLSRARRKRRNGFRQIYQQRGYKRPNFSMNSRA